MKLYSYWRSGTSYRVRLALAFKGIQAELVPVNLLSSEHKSRPFLEKNPQGLVPTLELDDGSLISQSPAIIEFIEDSCPGPALFPSDPTMKAKARQLAAMIGCDVHPLQNLRVLRYIHDPMGHSKDEAFQWAAHWIEQGLQAMEEELARLDLSGAFAMGDTPGVVECYLLPQLYAARRFEADLTSLDRLLEIEHNTLALDAAAAAHPDEQIDASKG